MDPLLEELIEAGAGTDEVEVMLKLRPGTVVPPGVRIVTRFGNIVTCRVRRDRVRRTRDHDAVVSAKAGRVITAEIRPPEPAGGSGDAVRAGSHATALATGASGRGVVIGLVDWGMDFAHPNFRRADSSTRLLALWDQAGRRGAPPTPYGYGAVHTAQAIDRALRSADPYGALGYHPADSDPFGDGAHGTHVADITAGNGRAPGSTPGLAPEADIVFVHLAARDTGGLSNLGDTCRILEALDFIARIAAGRPWVINLSVGRCGGPHNGLTLVEQGMDQLLIEAPGRAIVQSTGNYYDTRGHAAGQLRPGETRVLTWYTDSADITPNELEIWYPGLDRILVELRAPQGDVVVRQPLGGWSDIVTGARRCGRLYHRRHDPSNGDHHIDIFLEPGAPAGAWRVTLIGEDVVDGRYDAWLERDSACPTCQSWFDPRDVVTLRTTGTICNSLRTIAVGAYDSRHPALALARFSSSGPTRDGRQKPDLVAPGVRVLAARSASRGGGGAPVTIKSGTSMAAPHVTGTIACMFEVAARPLWIYETRRLLLGRARGTNAPPSEAARLGSGYLDTARAIEAVRSAERWLLAPVTAPYAPTPPVGVLSAAVSPVAAIREEPEMIYRESDDALVAPEHRDLDESWSEVLDDTVLEAESGEGAAGYATGTSAIALAESVLHAASASPAAATLLAEVVAGESSAAESWEASGLPMTSPAELYDAYVGNGRSLSAGEGPFAVIGLPGRAPLAALEAGDVFVRRSPGLASVAHAGFLLSGDVVPDTQLSVRGWPAEHSARGWYGLVIEGGAFPHCAHHPYARRLLDRRGRVPAGQLILRLRYPVRTSRAGFGEGDRGLWTGEAATTVAVRVRNRILAHDAVPSCDLELVGTTVRATTNAAGTARIDLAGVGDGRYILRVTPASSSTDPVGPALGGGSPAPSRVWRPMSAEVTVAGERLTSSASPDIAISGSTMTVRVQPLWIRAANSSARSSSNPSSVTHIIVHHTAGPRIGPAINWFLDPAGPSAHYLIDTDGEIVKMVHESRAAWHAGAAHWGGRDGVNDFSVGIEVVHERGEYPAAQYNALLALLGRIRGAYPSIGAEQIVGHSDIATGGSPRRLGRKSGDPGLDFDWARLEAAGLGIVVPAAPLVPSAYGGFFATVPGGRLIRGDRDSDHRYGGVNRPAITVDVIRELQSDLRAIGYFCPLNGSFDTATEWTVRAFQDHFFSGTRPRVTHGGQVDFATAERIKAVRPSVVATAPSPSVRPTPRAVPAPTASTAPAPARSPAPALAEWHETGEGYEVVEESGIEPWPSDESFDVAAHEAWAPGAGGSATLVESPPAAPTRPATQIVLHQATARLPLTAKQVKVAKSLDPRSGDVRVVATDARNGARVDLGPLRQAEQAAHARRYGKLHPSLFRELERHRPTDEIPVAIWVHAEDPTVDKSDQLRTREERPLVARAEPREEGELEVADEQEGFEAGDEETFAAGGGARSPEEPSAAPPALLAYRSVVAEAKARARRQIEDRAHVRVKGELQTVPLLTTVATKAQIEAIARLDVVEMIYLHDERGIDDLTTSMTDARADTVVDTMGWKGAGVRVAVWERGPDDLSQLSIAEHFDSARTEQSNHARLTTAIIKNSQTTGRKGYAPDCRMYSANKYTLEALEWAVVTKQCTVISQSFHRDAEQTDGTLSLDDRVKDHLAIHWPFPTIIQAAGNSGTPGTEFVNHKGYNSLAVGNHLDGASNIDSQSVFRNPTSPHGDRELPEITANGDSVSAAGVSMSGTSFAAPAVAGVVAELQSANTTLRHWPEGNRAILLAAAGRNLEGSTWWQDVSSGTDAKDGAGVLDAAESVRIAGSRRFRGSAAAERGFDVGTLRASDFDASGRATFVYNVQVPASGRRRVKVALAWNSTTVHAPILGTRLAVSVLRLDHDLLILDGTRIVARSMSFDNSYEIAEFRADPGKAYTIVIRRMTTSPPDDTWYGVAWTVHA